MLETKFVRQNLEVVQESLRKRGQNDDLGEFLDHDANRRAILLEVETLKHRRNEVSERIAQMRRNKEDASDLIAEMKAVSEKIKSLDEELSNHEQGIVFAAGADIDKPVVQITKGPDGEILSSEEQRILDLGSEEANGISVSKLLMDETPNGQNEIDLESDMVYFEQT